MVLGRAVPRIVLPVVVLTALLLATSAGVAHGHALLLRSEPATGTAVSSAPRLVSLWFSEPVQVTFNGIAVVDNTGRRVDGLDARVSDAEPERVDVSLTDLPQGSYVVRWQVTSADNHVVHGTTWFAVGFATAPPAAATLVGSSAAPVPGWEVAGRWLVYLAALFLAGAPLFRVLALKRMGLDSLLGESGRLRFERLGRRLAILAGLALLVGQACWLIAQLEAVAGTGIAQAVTGPVLQVVLLGSRFALLWWLRLVLGVAAAALLATPVADGGRLGAARRLTWVVGLALLATLSLGSHATGLPRVPAVWIAFDFLHLAAASAWLGGLAVVLCLLVAVRADPSTSAAAVLQRVVPRVSRIALVSVAVLVVTGVASAGTEIQTVPALLHTPYGQTLLVKVSLFLLLLFFAAANLLVIRRRVARSPSAGQRLGSPFFALVLAEVTIGALVAMVAGVLTSLPPPGQQPTPSPAEATRQAGDLRVTLTADPNWVGIGRYSVALADASGAAPRDVQSVTLTFTMQGMNMGRTTVIAAPAPDGTYAASGFFVGMPGISEVGVGIQRSDAPDQSAVFQIEVPDITQGQFAGLRPSAGIGPVGLFGLAVALVGLVALAAAWRALAARVRVAAVAAAIVALVGGSGLVLADQGMASTAGDVAANPIPPTADSLARGKSLYTQNCETCHGATGVGNGPAAAALLPPPSDLTLHARWHGDPQLFWFVTNGVQGTAMPSWAGQLSERDRWDVINYLHVLAEAPTATVQVPPVAPAAVPAASPAASPGPSPALAVSPGARPSPSVAPSPAIARVVPGRPPTPTPLAPAPLASSLSGRVAYGPDTDHDFWVIQLPNGRPQKITSFGRLDFASMPAWSPDGRQIAYSFYQLPGTGLPLPPGTDLYVMQADGSGQRPLATHDVRGAVLQNPTWSPDGAAIYASYQAQRPDGSLDVGIDRVAVADGSRTRVVSNAVAPAVSHDGKMLAYAQLPTGGVQSFTLWRSAIDGSAPVQLIGPNVFVQYGALRFSPGGRQIAFAGVGNGQGFTPAALDRSPLGSLLRWLEPPAALADGNLWDLWTIDVDGRNLHRLTAINEDLPVLAWSPDGRAIGFLGGGSAVTAQAGVSIINAGGSALLRLTSQPGHRGFDWTP